MKIDLLRASTLVLSIVRASINYQHAIASSLFLFISFILPCFSISCSMIDKERECESENVSVERSVVNNIMDITNLIREL